jgi:hypothetical protein
MPGKVETKHEMLRADYKFLNHAKCKSCGAAIEWWLTTNKKKMPYNPMPPSDHELVKPHWATCPKADEHRAPKQPTAAMPKQVKREMLQTLCRDLRDIVDAKVVVAIMDDGSAASWRNGISGEDLRQDLITEGNSIRRHIAQGGR